MSLKQKIIEYADKEGIVVGVSSSEDFDYMREKLLCTDVPFVKWSVEERVSPKLTMPTCNSIIAICVGYNSEVKKEDDQKLRGKVSIAAVGEDYHIIVRKKLEGLVQYAFDDNIKYQIYVDTGPLVDREVASRCGLGYIGKHLGLINDRFGSMCYIGYMLVDAKIDDYDKPVSGSCKGCHLCLDACPTGAVSEKGFNYKKCIAYLTQAKKLSFEQMELMGDNIYGCDMCQSACPHNRIGVTMHDVDEVYPIIEDLLSISNKDFDKKYKGTASGWRGKKILQRNAIIALGNGGDKRAISLLEKYIIDDRKEISDVANWSLNRVKDV